MTAIYKRELSAYFDSMVGYVFVAVLGKYFAMVTVFLIPVALLAFCPLIIAMNGEARLLSDYAALFAFFLMGCVFLAIGMFLSSLTESQIIAAVDYVTSDANHTVYTVTGHGEEDLSDPIVSAIEKANLNLESVSPALEGAVPEDCDVLVVNAPATDLSDSERTLLEDYLAGGGHLVFLPGDTLTSLPNWEGLLEGRGLRLAEGYIADPGSYYPQLGSAFAICGVLTSYSPVTDGCDNSSLTLLTNSRGFEALDPGTDEDWDVTTFSSTP